MKTYFCLLIFAAFAFLLQPTLNAQEETGETEFEEMVLNGKYAGGNVYILNPSDNGNFSVSKVIVNGKNYDFNHQSNAFEISLSHLSPDEEVILQVQYAPGTQPQIINYDCLIQESEFSLPSFIYNKKTKLVEWKIEEMDANCQYNLEQMLYGKWIVVKKLGNPSDMISNTFLPVLLSGMNLFRIVQTDPQGHTLVSPIVKLKSMNRRIMLMNDKVKDYIEFTAVTHYELYDANGFFIKRGTAQKVNVADLKKGEYWINFDGKEAIIMKK